MMFTLYNEIFYKWYRERTKHGLPNTEEDFDEYINRMSNIEFLREISEYLDTRSYENE